MCTVSYVSSRDGSFVFTSNRDESPNRNATELVDLHQGGKRILFPRDTGAKGTWIALSDSNQFVCILNGAFKKHQRKLPYRTSRGLMALEFFEYRDLTHFLEDYTFQGMEPFTMIIYDRGRLVELRWDAEKKHVKELDLSGHHIWSSCTLYPDEWVARREDWFESWFQANTEFGTDEVLDFHKNAGVGDSSYDVIMNRSDVVRTISISSIRYDKTGMHFRYENLLNSTVENRFVALPKTSTNADFILSD